ncbi:unnamed protein product, partial [Ectocarpus sp. 12 AP-2014]
NCFNYWCKSDPSWCRSGIGKPFWTESAATSAAADQCRCNVNSATRSCYSHGGRSRGRCFQVPWPTTGTR